MSIVSICFGNDVVAVIVEECDAEVVMEFLRRNFWLGGQELYIKPFDILSSLDIGAIKSGMHKYLVDFWTQEVDGVWTLCEASNVVETSISELHINGPVRKTAAYVWAHNEADAILRARRVLLDRIDSESALRAAERAK